MPEGDTVWRAARQLNEALRHNELINSDFRVPRFATVDLAGMSVSDVRSRGKHVLIELAVDLESPVSVVIHSTLGMDGAWKTYERTVRWTGGPAHQVRVVLGTRETTAVGYRLPHVDVLGPAEATALLKHLGPDLLGPDWNYSAAVQNIERVAEAEIAVALLDQRNLAGVGNVYKSELCFLARVNPWTPVSEVPNLASIVSSARDLLVANRESTRRVTTGDRRAPLWVYQRHNRPCRICGTQIEVAQQGAPPQQRHTWWCPTCQPR